MYRQLVVMGSLEETLCPQIAATLAHPDLAESGLQPLCLVLVYVNLRVPVS